MIDKIVQLDNGYNYLILQDTFLDASRYFLALRLDSSNEPSNYYLFLEECLIGDDTFLLPVKDSNLKGVLLTAFSADLLDKVYDEV